jgi:hydroxyacylglutathione hydrolase
VRTEDEFVADVLDGQPEPPKYFAMMKHLNKAGPRLLGGFVPPPRLDDRKLSELLDARAIVVDTRAAAEYAAGHLAGTINIPLTQSFVTWAGWLLPYSTDLYFIVDDLTDAYRVELVRQLALIGLDQVAGVFGTSAVEAAARGARLSTVPQMSAQELVARQRANDVAVLDVRNEAEWQQGHIPGALHVPLGYLTDRLSEIPSDTPVVIHCQAGARSAIAASVLHRAGWARVINLAGGLDAWTEAGLPVVQPGS